MRPSLGLLALACAAMLPGCQVTDNPGEGKSPLKVTHASGETIVPGRADRVVALESDALDASLALGVKPLGATTAGGERRLPGYLGAARKGIRILGPAWKVDPAAVETLDPDLILGTKERHGSLYGRLRQLTATVNTEEAGVDWKLNLRLYGEALGRPDAGERLLIDYDRRIGALRRAIGPRRREEVAVARTVPGEVRAYGTESYAGTILADAGVRRPPPQRRRIDYVDVSGSRIRLLRADVIALSRAPGSEATYRRLTSDPRWMRLPAVRSGRVYEVSDDAWAVGQGVLASRVVIRDLRRILGG
jgi:iron complex transport system substrate-binding protein